MIVNSSKPEEYVITLVASQGLEISSALVSSLSSQVNANHSSWLSDGEAVDLFCSSGVVGDLYGTVNAALSGMQIDVLVQKSESRRKKILIADMESTIIKQEMLDELAEIVGVRDRVAEITRRAMNGELDFSSALRERISLIKGKPASILNDVASRISLMPGAATLVATMKSFGAKCWLVSGGFNCFVRPVAAQLGFDSCYANELIVRDGVISGDVGMPILDKNSKEKLLNEACTTYGADLRFAVAVGDGANDIPMLSAANDAQGLGVAYHAKPKVREVIPAQINYTDLTTILFAQGYKREEFR